MNGPHFWIPPRIDADILARNLLQIGRLARSMPPAWDGAMVTHLLAGPGGEYCGKILPGRGVYLTEDLKHLGITRRLPHVYEDSLTRRLCERLHSQRGAITTYDGIIAARGNGGAQDLVMGKTSHTTVASTWTSLFRDAGLPEAGTYSNIPGGAALNKDATGAWSKGLTNPTQGNKKYLLTLGFTSASAVNMAIFVDLLVAAGNILATTNSAQTINSTALTRYTSGAGVLMTFEVTTAIGTTASNITVNKYTNQAGTANRSSVAAAMTPSMIVQRLLPVAMGPFVQFQTGDYGVRSVEEVTLSAAMSAGVFALNLYFPLVFIPGVAANTYAERESTIQIDGLTELVTTAGGDLGCYTVYELSNATSSGVSTWFLRTCEG